jgi:hypothetical protein
MPFFQTQIGVPANATIENVIAGSQWEFAPYDAAVEFGIVGSAAGLVGDVSTGSDVVAEAFSVSNANRFPILPDDYVVQDVVRAGERIKVRLRNTTANQIAAFVAMRLMPLAGR